MSALALPLIWKPPFRSRPASPCPERRSLGFGSEGRQATSAHQRHLRPELAGAQLISRQSREIGTNQAALDAKLEEVGLRKPTMTVSAAEYEQPRQLSVPDVLAATLSRVGIRRTKATIRHPVEDVGLERREGEDRKWIDAIPSDAVSGREAFDQIELEPNGVWVGGWRCYERNLCGVEPSLQAVRLRIAALAARRVERSVTAQSKARRLSAMWAEFSPVIVVPPRPTRASAAAPKTRVTPVRARARQRSKPSS
jgi:hypothetical protein